MSKNPRSISPTICDDMERRRRTRNTVPRIFIFGAGVRNWCRDSAALSRLGLISAIGLRCFATGWRNAVSYSRKDDLAFAPHTEEGGPKAALSPFIVHAPVTASAF